MKVGVIDYGTGNLGSVVRALQELRVAPSLIDRPLDLHAMDCFILPGVGNFVTCAALLNAAGWTHALRDEVLGAGKPLLGVCVGMQLLATSSVEGADAKSAEIPGLGFVPGRVRHLSELGCGLRVPHVGWNSVSTVIAPAGLFDGIPDRTDFYFVHSYAFVPDEQTDLVATTDYGVAVTAAVRRGHVCGTQFHPEKSSRAGFRLLRNFVEGHSC